MLRKMRSAGIVICISTLVFLYAKAMQSKKQDNSMHEFHTAKVFDKSNEKYTEVVFLESARFYKLPVQTKNYSTYVKLLKLAEKSGSPLLIKLKRGNSDTIGCVMEIKKPGLPAK